VILFRIAYRLSGVKCLQTVDGLARSQRAVHGAIHTPYINGDQVRDSVGRFGRRWPNVGPVSHVAVVADIDIATFACSTTLNLLVRSPILVAALTEPLVEQ
jgi:hypothetical protein